MNIANEFNRVKIHLFSIPTFENKKTNLRKANNNMKHNTWYSSDSNYPQYSPKVVNSFLKSRHKRLHSACLIIWSIFLLGTYRVFTKDTGKTHEIELWTDKLPTNVATVGNDLLAYRMAEFIIKKGRKENVF